MGTKHIHHDVIVAWAAGEVIQVYNKTVNKWFDCPSTNPAPSFNERLEYRIKPEKPSVEEYFYSKLLPDHSSSIHKGLAETAKNKNQQWCQAIRRTCLAYKNGEIE
jgi:hypothetical protein